MEYNQIKCDLADGVLMITLNRPERLNAFTPVMCDELVDIFSKADADDSVRVVIVTGAGRAFCAGADLGASSSPFSTVPTLTDPEVYRDPAGRITLLLYNLKKPVIAAINGPAVGVGITMTLAMDIRLAAQDARIGFVFTRRGLVPEGASTWFLPRIVGFGKAAELLLTGRVVGVQEAVACGLINEVLPPERLIPRAREIAMDIASNTSAVSVALSRQLLWKMACAGHPLEANRIESKAFAWMLRQPDSSEGALSFLEKRPPHFTMKPSTDMPSFYPWWEERDFNHRGLGPSSTD
jgi:enoyl-CoA hydratase/carnithine racemase